jgi:hypothetical protein
METYDIALLYRNPRHDSLNRKLAIDFAIREAAGDFLRASANIAERKTATPSQWTRRDLARVRKYTSSDHGARNNETGAPPI